MTMFVSKPMIVVLDGRRLRGAVYVSNPGRRRGLIMKLGWLTTAMSKFASVVDPTRLALSRDGEMTAPRLA